MIQMKLAILFNDNFRMEHLHNECNISGTLRQDKRLDGASGGVPDKNLHVFGRAALLRRPRVQT